MMRRMMSDVFRLLVATLINYLGCENKCTPKYDSYTHVGLNLGKFSASNLQMINVAELSNWNPGTC